MGQTLLIVPGLCRFKAVMRGGASRGVPAPEEVSEADGG
jgi:hypothetical protein